MKYGALFVLILSFLFTTPAHAVYLEVKPREASLYVILREVGTSQSSYRLFVQKKPFPAGPYINEQFLNLDSALSPNFAPNKKADAPQDSTTSITWIPLGLTPNTTYYVRVVETPPLGTPRYATDTTILKTNSVTITPSTIEFDYNQGTGTALIKGTVDTTKNPLFQNYQIRIQYSKEDFSVFTDTNPLKFEVYKSHDPANVEKGIASDGKYHIVLTDITPSTPYNTQEIIHYGGNSLVTRGTFNSKAGYVPSTTQTVQSDIENRSYRLLAPFPGLTVFMDPDLCAEQAAAGNTGQICDINDFLNFAFKVLIGAAAVLLVLRIMYEGFVYITSDIPKLKLSAKGHLMDGILGLLLALSAYLILNTINPKIVENTVSVESLNIGVTLTTIDPGTFQKLTGVALLSKSEYIPMVETAAKYANVEACLVKATIEVESKWNAAAIGCDENVSQSDVPSRMAFVGSGITLNGKKFAASSNADIAQKNDCSFDGTKASTGYGLDWRFSKGGGLMQVTVEPAGYKSAEWREGVKEGGKYWATRTTPANGWQTLLKPEENVKRGVNRLKVALQECNDNPEQAFRHYQSGGCTKSSSTINATVARKMALYNTCKAGN